MNSQLHSSERPGLPRPVDGELLSALADDQLAPDALAVLLDACRDDAALADQWRAFHLIGETLRSPGMPLRATAPDFASRLSQRLMAEKVGIDRITEASLARSRPQVDAAACAAMPAAVVHHRGAAANDSAFRWKLAAGFASLAAVSAIAWTASGLTGGGANEAPQLARASTAQPIVVASPQGPMVRDARLEELLAAHRQLGGGSALEAPSGFLRNATFEPSGAGGR